MAISSLGCRESPAKTSELDLHVFFFPSPCPSLHWCSQSISCKFWGQHQHRVQIGSLRCHYVIQIFSHLLNAVFQSTWSLLKKESCPSCELTAHSRSCCSSMSDFVYWSPPWRAPIFFRKLPWSGWYFPWNCFDFSSRKIKDQGLSSIRNHFSQQHPPQTCVGGEWRASAGTWLG